MNESTDKFIDLCLQGEAMATEIDEFVDRWHESDSGESLPEYLGMTEQEYALWVERPTFLKLIMFSRKAGVQIDRLVRFDQGHAIAARAASQAEINELVMWLKGTGRIPK